MRAVAIESIHTIPGFQSAVQGAKVNYQGSNWITTVPVGSYLIGLSATVYHQSEPQLKLSPFCKLGCMPHNASIDVYSMRMCHIN